jgi:hypothetical protein
MGLALLPNDVSYKWDKWGLYLMTVTYVPTFRALLGPRLTLNQLRHSTLLRLGSYCLEHCWTN